MGTRDPRVDVYIAKSADFARPVLEHLRTLIHAACPDVVETLKWSMPFFDYHGVLCHFAAFKQHCAFGFWKSSLIVDESGHSLEAAMGQFGRLTRLADLPSDAVLTDYLRKAMRLNETGVKSPTRSKPREKIAEIGIPDDLSAALKRNRKAAAAFKTFSVSQRREYIEWLDEAKREDTRSRRLVTAVEWIAEGKPRNWKYQKV